MKKTLAFAFPYLMPVITGYLFLGASYGIYAYSQGVPAWLTILSAIVVYAGSLQFASVPVFLAPFDPIGTALLTLMVNARHVFYAITMLNKYHAVPQPEKSFITFGLTDETFSIVAGLEPPESIDPKSFYFWVTLVNYLIWIGACSIGAILGPFIPFNTAGIEFVLTALFWTIFIEQWLVSTDRRPALIGVITGVICLLLFGSRHFMIPAMVAILLVFLALYYKEGRHHD